MGSICGIFCSSASHQLPKHIQDMLHTMQHHRPAAGEVWTDLAAGIGLGQNRYSFNTFQKNNLHIAVAGHVNPHDVSILDEIDLTRKKDFFASLKGTISLAVWDADQNELLLSRDKFGERSLYYWLDANRQTLVFASDIKAILAHPAVEPELDLESLPVYLAIGYLPGPRTLYKNIRKLLPSQCLQWQPGRAPSINLYWTLPPFGEGIRNKDEYIRLIKEKFLEGLAQAVDGRQSAGVFLSGGLDSSLVVAGLREIGVSNICTLTFGVQMPAVSESKNADLYYAKLVSQQFNTQHHEIVFGPDHPLTDKLPEVVGHYGDLIMSPNSYNKYFLVEVAHRLGLELILTGSSASATSSNFSNARKRRRLDRKTKGCQTDGERYLAMRNRLFPFSIQEKLLNVPLSIDQQKIFAMLDSYFDHIHASDFFRRYYFSRNLMHYPEKTFKMTDVIGNIFGMDIYVSNSYSPLVEAGTHLPEAFEGPQPHPQLKIELFKAISSIHPKETFERQRSGFPIYYWQNGELKPFEKLLLQTEFSPDIRLFNPNMVQEIMEEDRHSTAKSAGKRTWAMHQFALWHEIHVKRNARFL